jgi:hypothetical protein
MVKKIRGWLYTLFLLILILINKTIKTGTKAWRTSKKQ